MQDVRLVIYKAIRDVADQADSSLAEPLNDGTELTNTGLDSLGLAVVVSVLEEKLGIDPLAALESHTFPSTLGELIDMYRRELTSHA
jgi:acyl carrier protein